MSRINVEIWNNGRQIIHTEVSRIENWTVGRFKEVVADYLGWPPLALWTYEDETKLLNDVDRLTFYLTLVDHQRETTIELLAAIRLALAECPNYLQREYPELAKKYSRFRPYSRWDLIEEFVTLRQQMLINRPDEHYGPVDSDHYRRLGERHRELKALVKAIGVTEREITIAMRRIETRERLYQRPLGVGRPVRWALPGFWEEVQVQRNREKVRLQKELIHLEGKGREQ